MKDNKYWFLFIGLLVILFFSGVHGKYSSTENSNTFVTQNNNQSTKESDELVESVSESVIKAVRFKGNATCVDRNAGVVVKYLQGFESNSLDHYKNIIDVEEDNPGITNAKQWILYNKSMGLECIED